MIGKHVLAMGLAAGLSACAAAPVGPGEEPAPQSAMLDYIEPTEEPVNVGLAGQDPADIARYLLASGAAAPRLSPDGRHIAYRSSVSGERQLWVVSAEGGQPRRLTYGSGVTFFRWMPDSESLIYGADNDGDERESYFRIAADGSSEEALLPAVSNGFRSFGDISRDGRRLVFASTERNGLDFDIYATDLDRGETRLVYEGTYGFAARALSPDGSKLVVAETVGEDSDNLHLLDIDTGELSTLSAPEPRANHTDGGVAWAPDGSGFYFASNKDREFNAIVYYDMASGASETLTQPSRDATDVQLCGPGGRYLVFSVNDDGFYDIWAQDLADRGRPVRPPALPEGVYDISCGLETPRIAIGVNGWRTPGDVYVWNPATGETTLAVESSLAGLDPDRLVRPDSVRMLARDGVELQGLLYMPDAASREGDGPPPVIFEVHGGPTAQSMANFDPVVQYHVDRGFAVFEPNVRGSTGFGRTYTTLDDRENRRDSVRDLIDMLEALNADGRVDTGRAAVSGGSYGGYVVNAVLALYPGAFKAGVSRYGVADWVTALQIASPALKASDRIEYGDITEPRWLEFYTENSPIQLADNIDVPVLYSHGVMDPRIDISETETMVRALRANGVEAPFIRVPDEGHGWRKLKNRLFYYRREAEFLAEALAR
ncbi:MAG: S9 family peptidase [Pseudomonadota bacterium]